MPKVLSRFAEHLRLTSFFRLVLFVFVIEASWVAVSAAYPQAFDENFHFGLVKIYSHYWLPFLSHQPNHANAYGAVARDPSYLYHYLMSFPYRLVELFTRQQITQVIILRFINIALFSYGIVLFRQVMLRVGTSKALTNLIMMLFVLIPIVPQLAAQVNYDNLLLPLTAAMILLAFRITSELREKKISLWSVAMFLGGCLLTSLVKYAFLPIFAGMVAFLCVVLYRSYRGDIGLFLRQLAQSWQQQKHLAKVSIILISVISLGMFIQRDVINVVDYHNVEPNCAKVLSVKDCMAYSPWAYNYKKHATLTSTPAKLKYANPVMYAFQWLYWMWFRLFFAIDGPNGRFKNYPPLPLPSAATLIATAIGVIALIKWWRKIFSGNINLILLFVISVFYLSALFGQGYITYRYTDVLENMNGRYLLPVLLLVAAIFGQAISRSFRRNHQNRKVIFALVILLLFLEGGGVLTFIARSDSSWYVTNRTVVKVNNTARKVIKPVVVKGKKTYTTHLWFFN